MAFAKKSNPASETVSAFEKAKAFLNVSVKMADGKYVQIGGIALRESKALEAALIQADLNDLELECSIHHVVEKSAEDFSFAKKTA